MKNEHAEINVNFKVFKSNDGVVSVTTSHDGTGNDLADIVHQLGNHQNGGKKTMKRKSKRGKSKRGKSKRGKSKRKNRTIRRNSKK